MQIHFSMCSGHKQHKQEKDECIISPFPLCLPVVTEGFSLNLSTDPLLRDYWVYEGSLTTPPCSENVTWILYRYPLTISQLQIEEFRRLRSHVKGAELPEGNDGMLGDNFRPTQPLSDRTVRAAFQ
uniref:Carbonic anhydrase VIII n=1 Tax=Amphilophus citrinellus TaxID=61819 RepID=A0A3Q0QXL4_AMPCI